VSDDLPRSVRITEVGPRDGLQNEHEPVPTEVKVAFVRALVEAGHTDIEVSSFVRPDVVPQLADAEAVFSALGPPPGGVVYSALVPNLKGLERAQAAGVRKIAVFTAASESFNRRNVNASVAESIAHFEPVARRALEAGMTVRGYVSTAVVCPYEGRIAPGAVVEVARRLRDLGCTEVSVGDTIGAATPTDIARLLAALLPVLPVASLVLHLHDTRGMAAANVMEGLRHGVSAFDASAGGLGGCPFAPGSAGNLATEDLVFLLDGLGIEHGVDLETLRRASATIGPHLDHTLASRVYHAPPLPDA
jgi:isopropylmalate/homocitrate/citramalate synthase